MSGFGKVGGGGGGEGGSVEAVEWARGRERS